RPLGRQPPPQPARAAGQHRAPAGPRRRPRLARPPQPHGGGGARRGAPAPPSTPRGRPRGLERGRGRGPLAHPRHGRALPRRGARGGPLMARAGGRFGGTPRTPAEEAKHREVMKVFTGLLLALFVAMLSGTIVGNALPVIIADLGGTQLQYTWIVTAALLASTASTPIFGKLADLFDKKKLLLLAIALFSVGSVL